MAEQAVETPTAEQEGGAAQARRRWPLALAIIGLALLLALGWAWLSRERIATDLITGELERRGIPATYGIESIGPRRQVLKDIVVGDPARPDLTIERAEVTIEPRLGLPGVARITLVRPRLFGTLRDGKLSFGRLDPLLFGPSEAPFRLPDMDLELVDARARVEGDLGPIGAKADGRGNLRDGFAGVLGLAAPRFTAAGCSGGASLAGMVRIAGEKPRLSGPLRAPVLDCAAAGLRLRDAVALLDATLDPALDGGEGTIDLTVPQVAASELEAGALSGKARLAFRKGILTARPELALAGLRTPWLGATQLEFDGTLRAAGGLSRLDLDGALTGTGLRPGPGLDRTLADAARGSAGTLAAPLVAQLRTALLREAPGSRLAASLVLRRNGDATTLVVPSAALTGGRGGTLLALSRVQASLAGTPRLAGNFSTGGQGMPRISGRMERGPNGRTAMRMAMAPYSAGEARIAVPRLTLVQLGNGALGFSGEAELDGPLPGGRVRGLVLPVEGNWSSRAGLSVWRNCVRPRFAALALADLVIERRALVLCPPPRGAIVRSDDRGLRITAGTPGIDLAGRLGSTPIRVASGPVGFAWPGTVVARALDVALGPADRPSRFRVSNLGARLGGTVAGTFAGADVSLAAVPLDLREASGTWRVAGGRVEIADGAFRLFDRQVDARFQPLVAQGATLALAASVIDAAATLREPGSGREVVRTDIRHDLGRGVGHADLRVDSLVFDKAVQPDTLTRLALGVVANARGTVRGTGRIDWNPQEVTSTGRFATDSLDFAAAFGPVGGLSGEVVFTDLLGLVTAPDQRLKIASINPGIEVNDGALSFELRPGSVLAVNGARWPFVDGTLVLEPTRMTLGVAETRRYTLTLTGLNAAKFVERLELANISATGTFDGTMPLVFDENGGRIEGGRLASRPPGGNVSYVGELTYKDLSFMANFAFDALKSLDYREMRIDMNGELAGEIVTRVSFDGIRQGATARRNFVTRQVAKLPIRFNVNLRAPFIKLVTSLKSLYDPAYVRDPRTLGIVGADGRPIGTPVGRIQPPASGTVP